MPAIIIRETDKYIEYQYSARLAQYTRREQKYPCFGGPKQDQRLTETQLAELNMHYMPYTSRVSQSHSGYARYNSATGRSTRYPVPTCVFVWLEL